MRVKGQGGLYVPSDISDSLMPYEDELTQHGRERRTLCKAIFGGFLTVGLGLKALDVLAQEIDESQYKKVSPEELGLRFDYGPATKNRKHSNRPIKGNKYYYDVTIFNESNNDYFIDKLITTTPLRSTEISPKDMNEVWKTNVMGAKNKLPQPDRFAYVKGDISWPIFVEDTYLIRDKMENKYKIVSRRDVP